MVNLPGPLRHDDGRGTFHSQRTRRSGGATRVASPLAHTYVASPPPVDQCFRSHWLSDVPALTNDVRQPFEGGNRLGILDSFSNHVQVKQTAEFIDGADDRTLFRIGQHLIHVQAVNLHLGQRELTELPQRCVACAEVVQGRPTPNARIRSAARCTRPGSLMSMPSVISTVS